ncbi:hypothetical protein U0070_022496 [Myodes glareolus]|uniref:Uncharacterized protein n=1 Tax=Myodes glareolus TaxID=447135 RepID=A0AAW0HPS4_MYOGA
MNTLEGQHLQHPPKIVKAGNYNLQRGPPSPSDTNASPTNQSLRPRGGVLQVLKGPRQMGLDWWMESIITEEQNESRGSCLSPEETMSDPKRVHKPPVGVRRHLSLAVNTEHQKVLRKQVYCQHPPCRKQQRQLAPVCKWTNQAKLNITTDFSVNNTASSPQSLDIQDILNKLNTFNQQLWQAKLSTAGFIYLLSGHKLLAYLLAIVKVSILYEKMCENFVKQKEGSLSTHWLLY